jgi:hypothetical protein
MFFDALFHINYFAVGVATIAYFLVGSLWFSTLFGNSWAQELEKHGVAIKAPHATTMILKMVQTLFGNFITCVALALLIHVLGITTAINGLYLGLVTALGFVATSMGVASTWEGKSLKLTLIDAGYPIVGIVLSSVILTYWL